MTEEQKELLKDLIHFRTLDPFKDEMFAKQTLEGLRKDASSSIQRYKDYKKKLQEDEIMDQKIKDIIIEINKL